MEKIDISQIKGYEFIKKLLNIIDERWRECYLVGGAIRDYYLARPSCDLDFVLPWKEDLLARKFANSIKGKFFMLGEGDERVARVILRKKFTVWKFDFTVFRGKDIFDDLEKRDFTINALAVSIFNPEVIDIFGGISDIRRKVLNPVTRYIFRDDPLRILRAFRFSYSLSFRISDTLYELIDNYKVFLTRVSGERIRDEFFELLRGENFPEALLELYERKILGILFPSLLYDYELCRRCRDLIEKGLREKFTEYSENVVEYLSYGTSAERTKGDILKVSLLFLFLSQDDYMNYLEFLKLKRQEVKSVSAIIKVTREFLKGWKPSLEGLFSLPLYVQDELPGVSILLYLFDKISVAYEILEIYYKKLVPGRRLPRFIDGNVLQETWKIPQSPLIKEILDKVRIAQIEGKIVTKEDAYKFVDDLVGHLTL